jgi:hypothetical protein
VRENSASGHLVVQYQLILRTIGVIKIFLWGKFTPRSSMGADDRAPTLQGFHPCTWITFCLQRQKVIKERRPLQQLYLNCTSGDH